MNEEESPAAPALPRGATTIPDWLLAGLRRAGEHPTVVAYRAYRIDALAVDQPVLILPLAGTKRVGLGTACETIEPGAYLMIHHATRLQIENLPQGDEPYQAWAIGFPWRIVELARTLLAAHAPPVADRPCALPFTCSVIAPLLPALQHLLHVQVCAAAPDAALVDHALLGVLIALARSGDGQFLRQSDPSLSARIRSLVSAAPDREWTSADFEQCLHMSGATLRRRLAEENTSQRMLLREARLQHGLTLLQTGRRPLKSIAQACGYRSLPSFTRNFIACFGIEPSAVAGK